MVVFSKWLQARAKRNSYSGWLDNEPKRVAFENYASSTREVEEAFETETTAAMAATGIRTEGTTAVIYGMNGRTWTLVTQGGSAIFFFSFFF